MWLCWSCVLSLVCYPSLHGSYNLRSLQSICLLDWNLWALGSVWASQPQRIYWDLGLSALFSKIDIHKIQHPINRQDPLFLEFENKIKLAYWLNVVVCVISFGIYLACGLPLLRIDKAIKRSTKSAKTSRWRLDRSFLSIWIKDFAHTSARAIAYPSYTNWSMHLCFLWTTGRQI